MFTHRKNDRNVHLTIGAVCGAIIGFGLGILLAPWSGKETRDRIRGRAVAAKQAAQNRISQSRTMAMESLNRSLSKSQQVADKAAAKAKDAADATSRRAKNAASQAQADVKAAKTRRTSR